MSYENKYLKYKAKYLNLLSQIGGGAGYIINEIPNPNPIIPLILELDNYLIGREIRDYIVGVLQANMGGNIPIPNFNPPNHFTNNMNNLCNRFFNLFNNMDNFTRINLINRLNALYPENLIA